MVTGEKLYWFGERGCTVYRAGRRERESVSVRMLERGIEREIRKVLVKREQEWVGGYLG
jgi:hypothetical protein